LTSHSFYRKWRSQTFAEIVGQEHVTRTLLNALSLGRLSHAYLFCGPRGIGKTSTARVLAKAVNCQRNGRGEPCNECDLCVAINENRCLDVIELDAASNRGIDEIRDLREKVNLAPSQARYKFYILDEAHMLTTEACNALLKTLEEPPAHVIFILATTEVQRLPPTILSRCQRFDFRRPSLPVIVERLRFIAEREGLEVEPGALELIARAATGSLRDAVSLLDQLVAYSGPRFGQTEVRAALGVGEWESVRGLARLVLERQLAEGLRLINQVVVEGNDLRQFCREVVEYLRKVMLLQLGGDQADLVDATAEEMEALRDLARTVPLERTVRAVKLFQGAEVALRATVHPQLPLELALVEAVMEDGRAVPVSAHQRPHPTAGEFSSQPHHRLGPSLSEEPVRVPAGDDSSAKTVEIPTERVRPATSPATSAETIKSAETPASTTPPVGLTAQGTQLEQEWRQVIEAMGAVNKRIQALLRSSWPVGIEGDTLVVGFSHRFHQQAIEEAKSRVLVERVIGEVLGRKCFLRCTLANNVQREQNADITEDPLVQYSVAQGARIRRVNMGPFESRPGGKPSG